MGHVFSPEHMKKLDSPARRELLPPEQIVTKLALKPGSIVADLGCGIGYFTFPLAQAVGPEGLVLGLDIAPAMLEEAERRRMELHGAPANIRFIQSDEAQLPLTDQQVDVVFLSTVLHEIAEPQGFLAEIKRCLQPQGQLIVIEWKKAEMPMGPPITERLSAEQTMELLSTAGFADVQTLELAQAHYGVSGRRE